MARLVSLVVKAGALVFIVFMDRSYAIQLQLLGGVWIIQTLPAVFISLYTRWLDHRGLLLGWATGIGFGTWVAWQNEFKNANYSLHVFGYTIPGYAAVYGLVLNIAVAVLVTAALRAIGSTSSADATSHADFEDLAEAA
jgi:SSS family solute:Na+ symporter